MGEIDWESNRSHVFLNPRMPDRKRNELTSILEQGIEGHIWLCTSGTEQEKLVGLSKKALLTSAEHVNRKIGSTSLDTWLRCLPTFHVGGLSIHARAHLNGAKVVAFQEKWDVYQFHNVLKQTESTLVSLVPTQLYDIVREKMRAPKSLRVAIVGGGSLQDDLYRQGRELGWNLLPTYGMTETASQVALAESDSPDLKILPHMKVKVDENGTLCVKGDSLLTCYAIKVEFGFRFFDPKDDEGYFRTDDKGKIAGEYLKVLGRDSDFVKVGGELVSIMKLQGILEKVVLEKGLAGDFAIMAFPDTRLGHVIHLATTNINSADDVVGSYHTQVLPFERIREVHQVDAIPRSPLGKLLHNQLNVIVQAALG